MDRIKIGALACAMLMLAGCSGKGTDKDVKADSSTQDTGSIQTTAPGQTGTQKDSTKDSTSNTTTKDTDKTGTDKNTPVQDGPVQPAARQLQGEMLDLATLDKLDNTKAGWWIQLNKEHKTPTITPAIKSLIDKYGGYYVGDTSKKQIYLTFDEGYENGYTPKILDTLKANNVKTIFFITGQFLRENPDLVQRMLDEGHQVGNHSINHPSLPTVSNATMENELIGLEKQFSEKFGKSFKYIRPPMGEYSEKTLAACQQMGYKTIFWSFAYLDYDVNNQKGADNAYKMVMDNLHNGAIYLLHAVSKDNTEALDRIIKAIRAEGYTISPFDL